MAKSINPIGLLDLTTPQNRKDSCERVKIVLWEKLWKTANPCFTSAIVMIGLNALYWYVIRNPEQQIFLITITLAVFVWFLLMPFLKIFLEYQHNEKKLGVEDQLELSKSYIDLAKTFGSRVFRLKTTDKRVLEWGVKMKDILFKSFDYHTTNDGSYEIEVQF